MTSQSPARIDQAKAVKATARSLRQHHAPHDSAGPQRRRVRPFLQPVLVALVVAIAVTVAAVFIGPEIMTTYTRIGHNVASTGP